MSSPETASASGFPVLDSSKSFWHSEPSQVLLGHRTTPDLPEHADVVIVGSGMTGASVAWHLLQKDGECVAAKDLNVVMLEAREACWGATGRNGGHCQPLLYKNPNDPSIGHFELANFAAIQSLVKELSIDCEFYEQHGVRAIYYEEDLERVKASLDVARQADETLASRMHLVTEQKELVKLRIPTAIGAVVTDVAGRMWPYKFVAHFLERLLTSAPPATNGIFNLQTNTTVTSVVRADDPEGTPTEPGIWKVSTPRGSIVTPHVVLATNGYTGAILPDFKDLIVPCRGQMSALMPPPQLSGANRLKTSFGFLTEGQSDYLIQRPSDRGEQLMFGGGRSPGMGLGITDDSVIDPATAHFLRHELFDVLALESNGNTTHRASELKATFEWTGIMGMSRDSAPWVGPHPTNPGIFLAAGFSGHGMPNTWLCGQAAAKMVGDTFENSEASPESIVEDAVKSLKLPRSYVLTAGRLERAKGMKAVEFIDRLGIKNLRA